MKMYRAIFNGQRQHPQWTPFPTRIRVVVHAKSIYDVSGILAAKYDFISGLCVFSPDYGTDPNILELK